MGKPPWAIAGFGTTTEELSVLESIDSIEDLKETSLTSKDSLQPSSCSSKHGRTQEDGCSVLKAVEPTLPAWLDAETACSRYSELVESTEDVQQAMDDPEGFGRLQAGGRQQRRSRKDGHRQAAPKRQAEGPRPRVGRRAATIEMLDTIEEIRAAVNDVDAFLQKLVAKAAGLLLKMAIAKLRPKLEPVLTVGSR